MSIHITILDTEYPVARLVQDALDPGRLPIQKVTIAFDDFDAMFTLGAYTTILEAIHRYSLVSELELKKVDFTQAGVSAISCDALTALPLTSLHVGLCTLSEDSLRSMFPVLLQPIDQLSFHGNYMTFVTHNDGAHNYGATPVLTAMCDLVRIGSAADIFIDGGIPPGADLAVCGKLICDKLATAYLARADDVLATDLTHAYIAQTTTRVLTLNYVGRGHIEAEHGTAALQTKLRTKLHVRMAMGGLRL